MQAAVWYRKAADQGHAGAQTSFNRLGRRSDFSFNAASAFLPDVSGIAITSTLAVLPDVDLLASASHDNAIRLWNLETREGMQTNGTNGTKGGNDRRWPTRWDDKTKGILARR